jgi:hypothetical protein
MNSKTETGHAINVANLAKLIASCKGFGTDYNPTNSEISVLNLEAVYQNEKNALLAVNATLPAWVIAVNERDIAFQSLDKLMTKVLNAVKATNASTDMVKDVHTIIRKIKGERATPKMEMIAGTTDTPTEQSIKNISSSQKSFDNRINNLDKLIQLLGSETAYVPNETDLTIASLTTLLDDYNTKNKKVIEAWPAVDNARIKRDKILYSATGGADLSAKVKQYVRSVFGGDSPEYHQVSGLKFTHPRK